MDTCGLCSHCGCDLIVPQPDKVDVVRDFGGRRGTVITVKKVLAICSGCGRITLVAGRTPSPTPGGGEDQAG